MAKSEEYVHAEEMAKKCTVRAVKKGEETHEEKAKSASAYAKYVRPCVCFVNRRTDDWLAHTHDMTRNK